VYGDDVLVGTVTDWLLDQQRTVFQTFLLDPDEAVHSLMVLQRLHIPQGGKVASLGSGVGGMEGYWLARRPDIDLWLVNASMAQLCRAVCPATLVLCDMRDTPPAMPDKGWPGYDVVAMAYSLHHVDDVPAMIGTALAALKPGGALLVLDVVDGGEAYHAAVRYRTPRSEVLAACGLVRLDHGLEWHRQPVEVLGAHVHAVLDRDPVRPGMWLGMA